jgi:hypothetical protein
VKNLHKGKVQSAGCKERVLRATWICTRLCRALDVKVINSLEMCTLTFVQQQILRVHEHSQVSLERRLTPVSLHDRHFCGVSGISGIAVDELIARTPRGQADGTPGSLVAWLSRIIRFQDFNSRSGTRFPTLRSQLDFVQVCEDNRTMAE